MFKRDADAASMRPSWLPPSRGSCQRVGKEPSSEIQSEENHDEDGSERKKDYSQRVRSLQARGRRDERNAYPHLKCQPLYGSYVHLSSQVMVKVQESQTNDFLYYIKYPYLLVLFHASLSSATVGYAILSPAIPMRTIRHRYPCARYTPGLHCEPP